MTTLVANARMYAINREIGAAWDRLFNWIGARAEMSLAPIEHAAPNPLALLWRRPDLGCAMMCGYPWATWHDAEARRPLPLAVPVPSPPRFSGVPRYWSDIVVRTDSVYATPDDLAGTRFLFTGEDSQSGYQAPRAFFAQRARAAGGRFFGATIGPVFTPRRVVDTLLAGAADAGPLDAWWHELLRRYEPVLAARLRVVGRTPATPMPFLVCSAELGDTIQRRLAAALDAVADAPELAPVRDALLLTGFARVNTDAYALLARRADEIDSMGYARLQ